MVDAEKHFREQAATEKLRADELSKNLSTSKQQIEELANELKDAEKIAEQMALNLKSQLAAVKTERDRISLSKSSMATELE